MGAAMVRVARALRIWLARPFVGRDDVALLQPVSPASAFCCTVALQHVVRARAGAAAR
jgi:hypothetical protein